MQPTCIHLYCGSGKGKTTAALGQLLRTHGAGLPAQLFCFSQFFHFLRSFVFFFAAGQRLGCSPSRNSSNSRQYAAPGSMLR